MASETTHACRKCGETKPVDLFPKVGGRRTSPCKACIKKRKHEHLMENPSARLSARQHSAKHRTKHILVMNGYRTECLACGEKRLPTLDLHHKDGEQKLLTPCLARNKSLSVLIAECEKCVCLCANCHRLFHANDPSVVRLVEEAADAS